MDVEQRELEDSFEHGGATHHMWLHLPPDIWGRRIRGVVAATVTRTATGHSVELVDRSGSAHLFVPAESLEEASATLRKAVMAGDLGEGLPHAAQPDSPGDGA